MRNERYKMPVNLLPTLELNTVDHRYVMPPDLRRIPIPEPPTFRRTQDRPWDGQGDIQNVIAWRWHGRMKNPPQTTLGLNRKRPD